MFRFKYRRTWASICLILVVKAVNSEEIAKDESDVVSDFFNLFSNVTVQNATSSDQNQTVPTERITQPSAQTQQIERTLAPLPSNASSGNTTTKVLSGFRLSPQLETYYEFNKFPVPPAFPEAKHFPSFNFGRLPPASTAERVLWPEKSVSFPSTTEQPWSAKVKFPAPTVQTSKERPYQFYSSVDKSFPSKSDGFDFTKPVSEKPKSFDSSSSWDIWKQRPKSQQFDFTAPVSYGGNTHKTHFDYGIEKPHTEVDGHGGNPWKKIIKFLTAFIPIGLLISALTPTVITVTPMNGTQTRGRAEDSVTHQNTKKLMSSINYFNNMNSIGCEDRILCELLVSASTSSNAEQHVQNLLNTFTEDGKAVERTEDMKKVFEAVRKQDCRPIICKNIEENA